MLVLSDKIFYITGASYLGQLEANSTNEGISRFTLTALPSAGATNLGPVPNIVIGAKGSDKSTEINNDLEAYYSEDTGATTSFLLGVQQISYDSTNQGLTADPSNIQELELRFPEYIPPDQTIVFKIENQIIQRQGVSMSVLVRLSGFFTDREI